MKLTNVQYRYALNDNELIEIHDAHTTGGVFHCPQCGKKMICKCGSKKAWHFAHNKTECDYSKYLHNIAEQRLLEWFNSSNEIPIVLQTNEVCNKARDCTLYNRDFCSRIVDSDEFNLKRYYGFCEKEKTYEKDGRRFVADLLCFPNNNKNEPLFIEICVTHPCEREKIDSGIKIIEFVDDSEDDIDNIIGKQIKESDKVRLYNFHPKDKTTMSGFFVRPLQKFIVFPSKKGYNKTIQCSDLHERRGIIEISIPYDDCLPGVIIDKGFFQVAFVVSQQYDNSLKHCCLCKHYCRVWLLKGIRGACNLKNTNWETSKNDAQECNDYCLDEELAQLIIKEFNEFRNQNPIDIWIKNK